MFSGVSPGLSTIKATTGQGRRGGGPSPPAPVGRRGGRSERARRDGAADAATRRQRQRARGLRRCSAVASRVADAGVHGLVTAGSGGQIQSEQRLDGWARTERFTITGVTPDTYAIRNTSGPVTGRRAASGQSSHPRPQRPRSRSTPRSRVDSGRDSSSGRSRSTDRPAIPQAVCFQDRERARGDRLLSFSCSRPTASPRTPGSRRRPRMMRPATDGALEHPEACRAGAVSFLTALTDLEPGESNDTALLEQLAGIHLSKVTLRDGETTTQELRSAGCRTELPLISGPASRHLAVPSEHDTNAWRKTRFASSGPSRVHINDNVIEIRRRRRPSISASSSCSIMLAILRLGDDAYGVTIRDELERETRATSRSAPSTRRSDGCRTRATSRPASAIRRRSAAAAGRSTTGSSRSAARALRQSCANLRRLTRGLGRALEAL